MSMEQLSTIRARRHSLAAPSGCPESISPIPPAISIKPRKFPMAGPGPATRPTAAPAPAAPGRAGPPPVMFNNKFGDILLTEVIPMIDANYRTIPDRDHRAMAGLSMGGGQTLMIGLAHLETFS